VLLADYEVHTIGTSNTIKKTQFFGNQEQVSFYITKDGTKLDKAAVEKHISVLLNEPHSQLQTLVSVSKDGTITVTPYSTEDHPLTFWNWWTNWAYYFGLEGDDVIVTLNHAFGSADTTIDVVEEDLKYILLNVVLPLVIEIITLAFLLWWIYAIIAKPRFLPGAMIYLGFLTHGGKPGQRYHEISTMNAVPLKRYNKLKYRWKPTLKAKRIFIGKGVSISAGYDGSIICNCPVWYKGEILPKNRVFIDLDHPEKVREFVNNHDGIKIKVINPYDGNAVQAVETIDRPNNEVYYVHTNLASISVIDGIETIESGTIFAYAIKPAVP
jgi:hypothetical protein